MKCPECGGPLTACSPKFTAKWGQAWACRSGDHTDYNFGRAKGIRIVWPHEIKAVKP